MSPLQDSPNFLHHLHLLLSYCISHLLLLALVENFEGDIVK